MSRQLVAQIDALREESEKLGGEITRSLQEATALFDTAKGFEETIATLKTLREKAMTTEEFITDLKSDIKILDDTDEDLDRKQNEFQASMDDIDRKIVETESRRNRL